MNFDGEATRLEKTFITIVLALFFLSIGFLFFRYLYNYAWVIAIITGLILLVLVIFKVIKFDNITNGLRRHYG